MRAVIQRVSSAQVIVNGKTIGKIAQGLLILLGIENTDNDNDIEWLTKKIVNMRIFNDKNNIMNLSVKDIKGNILVISQFTLFAKTKKGNRPSYIKAAKPEIAIPLYNKFVNKLSEMLGQKVETGIFGAYMQVSLTNDGPVTIIIDSRQKDL